MVHLGVEFWFQKLFWAFVCIDGTGSWGCIFIYVVQLFFCITTSVVNIDARCIHRMIPRCVSLAKWFVLLYYNGINRLNRYPLCERLVWCCCMLHCFRQVCFTLGASGWKHFKLRDLPNLLTFCIGSQWVMGCICGFIRWFLIGYVFIPCTIRLSQLFVRLRNHLHPPKQKPRSEQKLWLDEWLEGFFVKKKGEEKKLAKGDAFWNGNNTRKWSVLTFDDSQSESRLDGCCFATCNSLTKLRMGGT